MKILVVDDEPPILSVLAYNLKRANYDVIMATDGEQAILLARQEQPDLIILDLMLPRVDGLDVFRTVRRERDVPVIMLTARDAEIDRVVGLELGADDYVVKPFSVRELMARVKNVLHRRTAAPPPVDENILRVQELVINVARHEAAIGATPLVLTALEFDVLYTLAGQSGRVWTREQLLETVWGYDYQGDLRVVDAVVKRLRSKLRDASPEHEYVITVRGVGYKLA